MSAKYLANCTGKSGEIVLFLFVAIFILELFSVLITGVSKNGIGLEVAKAFTSQLGCEGLLMFTSRSDSETESIIEELASIDSSVKVHRFAMNLDSFENVVQASDSIASLLKSRRRTLDILINNAGIGAGPLNFTMDGLECRIGVNHFGHYLLTSRLLYLLSSGGRVVNVSAIAHQNGPVSQPFEHLLDTSSYDDWLAYARSKTANILFTIALNEKYGSVLRATCLHPGAVHTNLDRFMTPELKKSLDLIDEKGNRKSVANVPGFGTLTFKSTTEAAET